MVKFFGWFFFVVLLFCAGGFFFDWVDLSKNKDEERIEFYLNTGKIGDDMNACYTNIAGWFD